MIVDGNPNPNALTPITVRIRLKDGREVSCTIDTVYGNPARPMSREAHVHKFRRNFASALNPLPVENAGRLIEMLDRLEDLQDVRRIGELLLPAA